MQRSNFEDWVGDEEDDYFYQDNRPRGGGSKKKRKKNKGGPGQETRTWDWDDIYDPTMPNSYADYKGSEEQFREIRDWKARLYYHMRNDSKKQGQGQGQNGKVAGSEDEGEKARPMNSIFSPQPRRDAGSADRFTGMFAPPSDISFAPPSFDDDVPLPDQIDEGDDYYPPPSSDSRGKSDSYEPPMTFAPPSAPDDATGEDAYLRRMRMSGTAPEQASSPPQPPAAATAPTPTPPPAANKDVMAAAMARIAARKAELQQKAAGTAPANPQPPTTTEAAAPTPVSQEPAPSDSQPPPPPPPPEEEPGTTISRAPVRYNAPLEPQAAPATEAPTTEDTTPKSSRPGQKGFAERLLKKYGWEKGQGLGASGEGITTALVGKVDKRKKLPDKEGGGWAGPGNMGKIVGGKRRKVADGEGGEEGEGDEGRFGRMSEVVKLSGMLQGLDVKREVEEGNLMQEIGDEFGRNYGNVERVFIWRADFGGEGDDSVFVKFTSQLSALRAVQGMDGVTFAGNEVQAGFWDGEAFERGVYA